MQAGSVHFRSSIEASTCVDGVALLVQRDEILRNNQHQLVPLSFGSRSLA